MGVKCAVRNYAEMKKNADWTQVVLCEKSEVAKEY